MRHIYDLACIFGHFPQEVTNQETARLAYLVLCQDAEEFGGQDPGFKEAPIERAREALANLLTSEEAREWYERFTTAMVYAEIPPFDEAVRELNAFADAWSACRR